MIETILQNAAEVGLGPIDLCALGLLLLILPVEEFLSAPRFKKRMANLADGERVPRYFWASLKLWTLAAVVGSAWLLGGRSAGELGLGPWEMDLPALVAMGLGALLAAFFLYQCAAMIFSPGARSAYREGVLEGGADLAFLPRTASERSAFTFLGLTAGVTEEVIYRGYLIWAFSLIMPQWGAALLALVAFTSMHAYQGPRGILPVAMAGAFLTVLYLLTGSLWPGIALHAWLDIVNGQTAYLALSDRGLARRQAA